MTIKQFEIGDAVAVNNQGSAFHRRIARVVSVGSSKTCPELVHVDIIPAERFGMTQPAEADVSFLPSELEPVRPSVDDAK